MFGHVMHHSQLFHARGSSTPEHKGDVEVPDNLQWSKLCEGSGNGSTTFVAGLYSVIWWVICLSRRLCSCDPDSGRNLRSFSGYSQANYALSEISDPIRTIKRANPVALAFITVTYLLINVAYFGAVSKNDILYSGPCYCVSSDYHDTCQDLEDTYMFPAHSSSGISSVKAWKWYARSSVYDLDVCNKTHRCSAS